MHRQGASRAATTAFLLSTPQTGVDSVLVTYAMMGPVLAVFRPLAALVTGLVGGGLVALFGGPEPQRAAVTGEHGDAGVGACGAKTNQRGPVVRMLRYGLLTLPRDIAVPLLVGIVVAGAISVLAPPGQLAPYLGGGVLSMVVLMAAGIPIYVCATASVPLAVGFMHVGASPGAALAFLIAGPGTNAAAFATIWKALGGRAAVLYIMAIIASALGFGLLLDWIYPMLQATLPGAVTECHPQNASGMIGHVSAVALLLVLAASSRWGGDRTAKPDTEGQDVNDRGASESLTLRIGGMTCSHCAESVRRAMAGCTGVASVSVALTDGLATVSGTGLNVGNLTAAVQGLGFDVQLVDRGEKPR